MNDEEWRKAVDEHLIRELLEDVQDRVKEFDAILRGERGHGGLISEYERHDEMLTRLYAVIIQDSTGKKGLLHDVDHLMGRKSFSERTIQFRWQSWTAIAVAVIGAAAANLQSLEKIAKKFLKEKPGILEQKIEKAKRPRGKKIIRYRVVPAPASAPSAAIPTEPKPSE